MYKILVVDDEDKITELLKIYLEMQGMEVRVARVSATLRRVDGYDLVAGQKELTCGDLKLDLSAKRLYKVGEPVELTALEYKMLSVSPGYEFFGLEVDEKFHTS
ncbi:MAG: hypothetical protein E7295_12320 [Lachnospiraceae bacterium]|jgi:DNA-binding response OmpR family regulator|nr:hypothetical protein [Lachnospiraceae bacterium]